MGRRKKVGDGQPRTTLYRRDQFAAIQGRAEALGVDFSDVARGFLDLVLPPDSGAGGVAGPRAAFELEYRRVRQEKLLDTLAGAWSTGRLTLPVDRKVTAAELDLLRRAADLARRLIPPGPDVGAAPDPELDPVRRWAAAAHSDLLEVLACPAVLAWEGGPGSQDGRPTSAVVPRRLVTGPGAAKLPEVEAGYEVAIKALRKLGEDFQPGPPVGPPGRRTVTGVKLEPAPAPEEWPAEWPSRAFRIRWKVLSGPGLGTDGEEEE